MASKYLQKFPVPAGFQQILSDFTRQVLRDQPANIIEYAAMYFEMLEKGKKLQFDSKYNVKKGDKKYELSYNAVNAQQISKKAGGITQKLNKGAGIQAVQQQKQVSKKSIHQQSAGVAPSEHSIQSRSHQEGTTKVIGTQKTVTGQQTSHYVQNLAKNVSDQQSPDQLVQPQQDLMQQAVQQTVDAVFSKFDVDKNGYLASKQIHQFIVEVSGEINQQIQGSQDDIEEFIQEVDKDMDGKISKQELAKFIRRLMGI